MNVQIQNPYKTNITIKALSSSPDPIKASMSKAYNMHIANTTGGNKNLRKSIKKFDNQ